MSINDNTSNGITVLGKTHRNIEGNSIYLTIPNQLAKELGIENSRVNVIIV